MNPETQPIKCCVIGIVIRTRTRKWPSAILLTAAVPKFFSFTNSAKSSACCLSSVSNAKSTSRAVVKMSPSLSFFRRRSVSAIAVWWSSSRIVIEVGYLVSRDGPRFGFGIARRESNRIAAGIVVPTLAKSAKMGYPTHASFGRSQSLGHPPHAALPPSLAKNARMGHPQWEWCVKRVKGGPPVRSDFLAKWISLTSRFWPKFWSSTLYDG